MDFQPWLGTAVLFYAGAASYISGYVTGSLHVEVSRGHAVDIKTVVLGLLFGALWPFFIVASLTGRFLTEKRPTPRDLRP